MLHLALAIEDICPDDRHQRCLKRWLKKEAAQHGITPQKINIDAICDMRHPTCDMRNATCDMRCDAMRYAICDETK